MRSDYLTTDRPMRAMVTFALPMIIGNLFQSLYTMVDSAIVGRFVGTQALAAVGASYALTNVFIWIAIGGGIGSSVIVSRYFGAGAYRETKTAIYTVLLTFLVISLVLGGFGLLFSREIMALLKTPADVLDLATTYLNIYFLGLPFLFMYNILSSMFNALGKSRIPLYFLIFSSLFNVVLDWVMVTQFGLGVAGVAWATLIAQGLSALLSFAVLLNVLASFNDSRVPRFSRADLKQMTLIALPSILQQSTVSIGMLLVQSVVNSFGSEAMAGFSAAMRIDSLCVVPMAGISAAMSSYTAQNIGAGKLDRVVTGYHEANKMVAICAVVLCVTMELFYRPLIGLFLDADASALAIATGEAYLRYIGFFFVFIGIKMAVDGVLRGAGDMRMFTVANLVNLSIRVVFSVTLAPVFGLFVVWAVVPLGWFANFLISWAQYRTGKWRRIHELI